MGRACRAAVPPTSGRHPDLAPRSSRCPDADLCSTAGKMGSQTSHLVGRAEELSSLDRALADLDEGRFVAVLLVGEPGIGKTRLLAELGSRADAQGHLVLEGSGSELEGDLPFSVFVDA